MMNVFRKTVAVFFVSLSFTACDKSSLSEETVPPGEGKRTEMTFGLSAADMTSPLVSVPVAKADVASAAIELAPGVATRATEEGTAEEKALTGLWVLQFDGTQASSKLVLREYYASDKIQNNSLSVALMDAASTRVYFVGNVAAGQFSSLALGSTTLSAFEALTLDVPVSASASAGLPMVGVYEGSTSAATASVALQRMVAKIAFTCNVQLASSSDKFTVKKVQLKSSSVKSAYKAPSVPTAASGLYPDASVAANFADVPEASVSGASFTRTWYVAENLRGVVSDLTDKTKGGGNVPARSTYIEVSGDYTQDGETFEVAYRIYPGANSSTDFNLVRNHIYTVTSTIKGANENDLRVVYKDEDLSVGATANCYMVPAAGTSYKFKATVMGNGATTLASVSPATGAQIVPSALAPASARVLWETGSKNSVISSVDLKNGYVYFTTAGTKGSAVSEGNALIGVFSGSGTLLWSWHIWATGYDPATSYDTYSTGYKVMQYNLGADASSEVGTVGQFGLLYQWGRKDPFIGSLATSGTDFAATANDSAYPWSVGSETGTTGTAKIALAVQNPTTFYPQCNSTAYDWVATSSGSSGNQLDNLWGNPNTTTSTNTEKGSKSVYDPCPPGWRVPPQDTWVGATTANSPWANIGRTIFGMSYYPAAGCRNYDSGQLNTVGSSGNYWSSSPYSSSSNYAGYLYFGSSSVSPLSSDYRASGRSVRCVQE